MFLHYINTKQKHINYFFCQTQINILIRYSPHPLRCSFSTSLHPLIYSIRQRREMYMKQSPYQLHPQQFLSSSSSFYIMLHMCILWCVSSFEKKTYSEKYEWESSLLLSELSISALSSHSCLHVQELHITHTHTHTHTIMYIITRMFQSFLMFTNENKKYTRSSKLTM